MIARQFLLRTRLLVCATLFVAGCADGTTEAKPRPGLQFVSGASGADTIEANIAPPLILEYRDSTAKPLGNRPVVIFVSSLPTADSTRFVAGATLTFDAINTVAGGGAVTDANGRITIRVRLGQAIGNAVVSAGIAGGGTASVVTATYIVRPGAPARVTLLPRDTVVYPAARLEYRVTGRDRYRNPTTGAVAVTYITTNDLTVSSSGIATPRNAGRDTIIARVGALADTVLLTVLPVTGTIVSSLYAPAPIGVNLLGAGIATMNLDGSGYKEYARSVSASPYVVAFPRWSIDKKSIFARIQTSTDTRIWTVPLDGTAPKKFLVTPTSPSEDFPSPSPDGQWVYYHTGTVAVPSDIRVYRARVDGTGIENLVPESPLQTRDLRNLYPQVSPSGEWLAYTETNGAGTSIRSVTTGIRTPFYKEGYSSVWAPTGTRIAYIKGNPGPIWVAEYDGTQDHLVSQPLNYYGNSLSWTTDGKYLLAFRTQTGMWELLDVATSASYPLPLKIGFNAVLRPYN